MNPTDNQATPPDTPVRDLYDWVTGDEQARVCRDISESACREQPPNFFIHLVALLANKAGDLLASPKLVLPWLLGALGAPLWMIGWLVPIRESLALLPQLAIAGWMRAAPRRKWFWVAGAVIQGASVLGMAGAAIGLQGRAAGAAVLALLALFSLGRGACSVAYKDVQGKTIAKNRRGTLSGYAASAAGGIAMLLGLWLWLAPGARQTLDAIALLLALAGALWLGAALVFAGLREMPGANEGGGNALKTAWHSLYLIKTERGFARFIAVRGLLIATALAAPFYAELARRAGTDNGPGDLGGLAILLAVSGLASLVSAPFWGRFSDRSARSVLVMTGATAAALNLAVASIAAADAGDTLGIWPFAVAYFLLAGLHAGVRLGRKTYLVDLADADNRARMTAVANTIVGLLLLFGGAAVAAAGLLGAAFAVAVLALPAAAAACLALGLPFTE